MPLLAFLVVAFCLSPLPADAQAFTASKEQACRGANLSNNETNCRQGAAGTSVSNAVKLITNILTTVVGIAAVISIIINGLRFIMANGDSNSISSARTGIIYALIGLSVAALAQVSVRFILSRI